MVKGLIELHAGSIEATSPGPGHGATFTIHLPLWRGPQLHEAPPNEDAPEADPLRVLVVDDNRDVLHLLSKLLKLRGHTVAVANDGSKGVEMAREFRPDLVLCDIGLPGEMNGYKVAETLRTIPSPDARGWSRSRALGRTRTAAGPWKPDSTGMSPSRSDMPTW